jgi:hypothetical protein
MRFTLQNQLVVDVLNIFAGYYEIIGKRTYKARSEQNAELINVPGTCYIWLLLVFESFKSPFLSVRKFPKSDY